MSAFRLNKLRPKIDVRDLRLYDPIIVHDGTAFGGRLITIKGIVTYDKIPDVVWIKESNKKFHRLALCRLPLDDDEQELIDFINSQSLNEEGQ